MELKPLYDRVVILPQKTSEVSAFGIILPQISDEKSCIGKVVCIGDGQTFDGNKVEMMVKNGDRVLYSKFAGSTFKMDDENYLIVRQADILAVIKED